MALVIKEIYWDQIIQNYTNFSSDIQSYSDIKYFYINITVELMISYSNCICNAFFTLNFTKFQLDDYLLVEFGKWLHLFEDVIVLPIFDYFSFPVHYTNSGRPQS